MSNDRERAAFCPQCRKLIPRNAIICPSCETDLIRPGRCRVPGSGAAAGKTGVPFSRPGPDSVPGSVNDRINASGYGVGTGPGPGGPDMDSAVRFFTSLRFFSIHAVIRAGIGINILFFTVCLLLYPPDFNLANPMRALSPDGRALLLLGASGRYPLQSGQWWTLLSAGWLHGSLLHIVFNMLAFRHLGAMISQLFGLSRMIIIYTLAGISGFTASWMAGVEFTIGASASLCGLLGAALYFGKSRGGQTGQAVFQHSVGWVIGLILIGLMPGIDNWGHGGGLLGGVLLAALLGYRERRPVTGTDWIFAAGCILVTGLVLSWALFSGLVQYAG